MCCFSQSTHYCAALISAVLAAAIFLVRAGTSGHYFIGFFSEEKEYRHFLALVYTTNI